MKNAWGSLANLIIMLMMCHRILSPTFNLDRSILTENRVGLWSPRVCYLEALFQVSDQETNRHA